MAAYGMKETIQAKRALRGYAAGAWLRPGITLVEIMVAMSIMTIGVLGMVGAFKFFNVGVQSAKTRSLANNIAQERIEFLKNKSYYRIMVSTDTDPPDTNFDPPMVYDHAPNGEETVNVGGISFIRRVLVRKVNERPDHDLEYLSWEQPDTGLKEIKVYVVWYERGEWRKLEVRNLRENPDRVNKDSTISGSVTKSGTGADLAGVIVRAQESPSYYGETNASGDYSFSIVAGTYTLLATKDYYFPSVLPSFGLPAGTDVANKNFTLTEMSSGTINGYVFIDGGALVISNIAGSTETDTGDTEWVEVYNPTTWTWTMATGLGTGANEVITFTYKEANVALVSPDFNYRTTTLDPGRYYLFANTGTVSAAGVTRQADAMYSRGADWTDQDDVIESGSPSSAGVVTLKNAVSGQTLDKVGWTATANGSPSKQWPDSYEYFPIYFDPAWNNNVNGLTRGAQFVRHTWFWDINPGEASCYDSNMNYYDFRISSSPLAFAPRNSGISQTCASGVTADGAIVFANDGISSPVSAGWAGYFNITQVATGTWTVFMSSGVVYSSVAYYGGTANNYWSWAGYNKLSTPTAFGYVTGRVTDVLGAALPNIKMFSPGNSPVYTNASGRYTLPVDAGVVTVKANYQSYSPSYVELSSADIVVDIGEVQQGVDFALYQGGRIRGRVTTNGVDALPGIPVIGLKGGVEQGSGISDSDGYFMISGTGISTGTYSVVPQLEAGESASPASTVVNLTAGVTAFSSTFTVSGAFGYVTGSVTNAAGPITTGVMVYVTTSTLGAGAGPPDVTPALRGGTGVYYAASSSALGTYSIPVKGGYTYNVYAWYTTWTTGSNPSPTTTRRDAAGVVVAPNATVTRSFAW